MTNIVELILSYRKTHSEEVLKKILDSLFPMMLKRLKKIPKKDQEDILQEFKMGLYSLILKFEFQPKEIDSDLFNSENKNRLLNNDTFEETVMEIFHNPYILCFLKTDHTNFWCAFESEEGYRLFTESFFRFNAQNQFLSVLNQRLNSIVADFFRKNENYFKYEKRILNRKNGHGQEFLYQLKDKQKEVISFLELGFSQEDAQFLSLFISGSKINSQAEVAYQLGISQQSVSKKMKQIYEKYKFFFEK